GHRATHCKHTDRKLISIKKKGRPATQCKRCRELRVLRQLHVKCDCEDPSKHGERAIDIQLYSYSQIKVQVRQKRAAIAMPILAYLQVHDSIAFFFFFFSIHATDRLMWNL
ncbi:copper fist DNA-binding transcription factor, partial [Mucor lusitanicus CBS 277.49]